MGIWAFVDVWLLAAAILSIVMSFVWRQSNLMLNLTLNSNQLLCMLLLSWCCEDRLIRCSFYSGFNPRYHADGDVLYVTVWYRAEGEGVIWSDPPQLVPHS